MAFAAGNIVRAVINSNGNLGIGETNPSYTLEVGGTARINSDFTVGDDAADSVTFNASTLTFINSSNIDLSPAAQALNFESGLFNLDAAGARVGIGTTAPSSKLEVVGEVRGTRFAFQDDTNTYIDTQGADEILFATNGSTKALLNINGNLGIGTTAPAFKLDVNGDVRVAAASDYYVGTVGLNDNASASSGAGLIGLYDNTYSNIVANTNVQGAIGELDSAVGTRTYTEQNYVTDAQSLAASVNALDMMLQNVVVGSTGIWIDSGSYIYPINYSSFVVTDTGRLGIGTTTPAVALEVVGEVRGTRFAFQDDTNTYIDTQGADEILFATNGSTKALLNINGNLGIGTTAPAFKLDVNGDVRVAAASDYYVGTVGLNDNASASSGAGLIGLYDNTYSNIVANTNVQGAIGELDSAVGTRTYTEQNYVTDAQSLAASVNALDMMLQNVVVGSTGIWIDSGSYIYPINYSSFVVTDTGRLGIGTTTPAVALEVVGEVRGTRFAFQDDTNTYIDTQGADEILFATNGSTKALLNINGNLGIGTTAPAFKLDVNGDVRVAAASDYYVGTVGLNDNASASSGAGLIGLYDNTYSNIVANTNVQGAIGELDSAVGTRTYTEQNYVTDAQSLAASVNALDMMLQNVVVGSTGIWIDSGSYIYPINYSSFVVTDTGRLGIGTTTPAVALEVVGEVRGTRFAFQDDTDTYIDTSAANTIVFATGGSLKAAINSNGNLGIGTTAPGFKLDVSGNVHIANGNNLYISNAFGAINLSAIGTDTSTSGASLIGVYDQFFNTDATNLQAVLGDLDTAIVLSGSKWTDSGATTYLTQSTDNVAVGGSGAADSYFYLSGTEQKLTLTNTTAGLSFVVNDAANDTTPFVVNANGNVGIGTSTPAYTLDINGNARVTSGNDYYVNTVGFNDNASTSSGASLIGLYDNSYSNVSGNTTVQSAIGDIDSAVGNRTYSNDYNISDLQSVTASLDAVDVAIGSRTYTEDNYIADAQNLTASIDALDMLLQNVVVGSTGLWLDQGAYINPTSYANIVLTDTGRLGIGTTNPGVSLEVAGEVRGTRFAFQDDTNTYIDTQSADVLSFVTGGSTRAVINTNGNLGLGTTAPTYKVDVIGDISISSGDLYVSSIGLNDTGSSNITSGASLVGVYDEFTTSDATTVQGVLYDLDTAIVSSGSKWTDLGATTYLTNIGDNIAVGGTGTTDSIFFLDNTNNLLTLTNTTAGLSFRVNDNTTDGTPFVVDGNGNVGIGNSAPGYTLDVNGNARVENGFDFYVNNIGLNDNASTSSGASLIGLYDNSYDNISSNTTAQSAIGQLDAAIGNRTYSGDRYITDAQSLATSIDALDTALFNLEIGNTGLWLDDPSNTYIYPADATLIAITDTGRLGIGTTSPSVSLEVVGEARAQRYAFEDDTNTYIDTLVADQIAFVTNGGYRLLINAGGNLGIGTTNPTQKLDVVGNGTFTGTLTASTNGTINGIDINAGAVSDVTTLTASSTITFSGLGTGTDNTVVIQNGSNELTTDEINDDVWDTSVDFADVTGGAQNYIAKFNDEDTLTISNIYDNGTNIGIGLTNPLERLEISGNIKVQDDNWLGISSSSERIVFDSNGDDIELMNANVGIGTTNPAYLLDVNGDVRVAVASDYYVGTVGLNDNGSALSGAGLIGLYDNTYSNIAANTSVQGAIGELDSAIGNRAYTEDNYVTDAQSLASSVDALDMMLQNVIVGSTGIWIDAAGYIYAQNAINVVVTDSGNFGIGTTNPTYKLDVNGDARIASGSDLYIGAIGLNDNTTAASGASLVGLFDNGFSNIVANTNLQSAFGSVDSAIGNRTYTQDNYIVDAQSLALSINALDIALHNLEVGSTGLWLNALDNSYIYPSDAPSVVITDTGRLGVGTTAPATALEVVGEARATRYAFQDDSDTYVDTLGSNEILFVSNGANQALINANGNLGIGTTAPTYKLDVNGDIRTVSGSDFYVGSIGLNDNGSLSSGASLIGLFDNTYSNIAANTTVQGAIGELDSAIGNRAYTEDNYVTDAQSLTASVNALDMMLQNVVTGSTGLWIDTAGYIYAQNASNVVISDTGNLGIGTTAPSVSLEVVGEARATRYAFQDDSDTYVDTLGSNEILFVSNGANQALINANGNLGIGTTAPTYKLDVNGDARITLGNDLYITTAAGNIALGAIGTDESTSGASLIGVFDEFLYSNSTTVQGVLDDIDNALTVAGSKWTDTGPITYLTQTGDNLAIGGSTASDSAFFLDNTNELLTLTNTTGGLTFVVNDSASDITPFVISGDGNVGIGTTAPSVSLEVVGEARATRYAFQDDSDTYVDTLGSNEILFVSNGANQALINANGNLGIGTTAPTYKLDVNGDIRTVSGSDFYVGSIGLNDNGSLSSGASLIGLFDNTYSNIAANTTVQGAIGELDSAIGNRAYTEDNYVTDAQSLTASVNALDMMLQNVVTGSTGLWIDTAGYIYAQNASNVVISDTGNLGIGTTAPSVSLEVVGEARATRYAFQDDSDTYVDTLGSNEILFVSNGANQALINANGNLGIGTTAPTYKLDVNGDIRTVSGSDFYVGSIGLNDNGSLSSGASLIGLFDNTYSNIAANTTVQGAIGELDSAIGTRSYSEQNYISNLNSLTTSVNDLDTALYDLESGVTGLWREGGSYIYPANATNLSVSDTGNLGIGTTAPSVSLEVVGEARATRYAFQDDSDTYVDTLGSNEILFVSNGANQALINANGNLGIGTTAPTYKLDVNGDIRTVSGSDFYVGSIGLNDNGSLSSGASLIGLFDNTYSNIAANTTVQGAIGELDSAIGNRAYTNNYLLADSQSVTASLDAVDSAIGNRTYTEDNYVTDAQSLTASVNALDMMLQNVVTGSTGLWIDTAGYIYAQNASNVVISDTGNLGIGTTAPSVSLEVVGEARATRYAFQDDSDTYVDTLGSNEILFVSNGANQALINANGNLGIGTTAPTYKLDVNGDIRTVSGSDFYVGSIGLNDNGSLSSGASLIGLFDNTYSNIAANTTVQGAIGELDSAIGNRAYTEDNYVTDAQSLTASVNALDMMLQNVVTGSTGLWIDTAGYIYAQNASNVVISDTGNLGIGTTAPSVSLEVVGEARATRYAFQDDSDTYVDTLGSNEILFVSNGANQALINANGNLGIGTTAPTYKLDVNGDARITLGNDLYITTAAGNIALGAIGTDESTSGASLVGVFDQFANSNADNVQDVLADLDQSIVNAGSKWTDTGPITYLTQDYDSVAIGGSDPGAPFFYNDTEEMLTLTNTTSGYSFRVNDSSNDTTPFVIDAAGNVGIGVSLPSSALEIAGNITLGDDNWIGEGAGVERIAFDSNGDDIEMLGANVGIGTTDPQYLLDVNGDVRVASGSDFYVNSVGLNDNGSLSSGASLVGLFDNTYANIGTNTNVQDAIGSLDGAIGNRSYSEQNYVSNSNALATSVNDLDTALYDLETGITGLWREGGSYIYPANASNVSISDSGRLGIGTTAPSVSLEVVGEARATRYAFQDDSDTYVDTLGSNEILFVSNGANQALINANGNLGIGTTAPTYKLDVNGDIRTVSGSDFYVGSIGLNDNGSLSSGASLIGLFDNTYSNIAANTTVQGAIGELDSAIGNRAYTEDNYVTDAQSLTASVNALDMMLQNVVTGSTGLWIDTAGYIYAQNASNVVISDTGNLGIGTTAPSVSLEVVGEARATRYAFQDDSDTYVDTLGSNEILFVSNGANQALINANGNLGIGTTAPTYKLDVNGDIRTVSGSDFYVGSIGLNDNGSLSSGASLIGLFDNTYSNIAANTTVQGAIGELDSAIGNRAYTEDNYVTDAQSLTASVNALDMMLQNVVTGSTGLWIDTAGYIYAQNASNVVISDTGNLGIGTTNPIYALDVAGDIRVASGSDYYLGTIGFNDNASTSSGAGLIGLFDDTYSNIAANTTVQGAIGELDSAIGNRAYTNNYLLADSQSVTASLDAVDSAIGNRAYTEDNYVTDAQSLTASVNALDMMLQNVVTGSTGLWIDTAGYIYAQNASNVVVSDTGNLGIGTTNPTYKLDVNGDARITLGNDLYITTAAGNIALGAIGTDESTSGASLVGVFDEFLYSNSTTVQGVLDDIDTALASGFSKWTDTGPITYLTQTGDNLAIGGSTASDSAFFLDNTNELLTLTNTTGGLTFVVNDSASDITPFVISGDGNVGIGTTAPSVSLEVVGEARATRYAFQDDSDTYVDTLGSNEILFVSNGANQALINANGNLGIGTTAPTYKLDVNGDIRTVSGSDFYVGSIGLNDNGSLSSGASLIGLFDNTYSNIAANTTVQGAIGDIDSAIGNRAYTNNYLLADSQSVTASLDAVDSAIGNRAYTEDNYVTDAQSLTASINALDMMLQNVVTGSTGLWIDTAGYIYAQNASNVVISDTGNLGIGTTAPSVSLEVVGEARATRYAFQDDSDTYVDTLGSNEILFVSNGANQALINANGNLGIGTTAPTYKLDVNGDIRTVSGSDFYVGSIGLNDNGSLSSGASLIGLFDNTYSNIAANTTVQGAIGELDSAIGNRAYTNNYLLADSQSVTASLDAVDSAIGNRTYTEDNYVTDAQSLTASVNALDLMLQNVASGSTGLWLDAAGYIYANNATNVIVTDTGNIGVGTTNPVYTLDVNGDVRAASGSDFYVGSIGLNDNGSLSSGASLIGLFDNTYSNIAANTTVQGAIGDIDSAIGGRSYTQDNYVADAQSLTASIDALDIALAALSLPVGAEGQTLHFTGGAWSSTYSLFNNGTNIGIGTTTPGSKLEVAGNITVGDDNWFGLGAAAERISFDSDGDDIEILGANVGIGTTNPVYTLDVNGDVRAASGSDFYLGTIGFNDNASTSSGASLIGLFDNTYSNIAANTTVQGAIGDIDSAIGTRSYTEDNYVVDSQSLTASVNALDMMLQNVASGSTGIWLDAAGYIYANNATSVVVTDTGRLGVGTTAPGYDLEVNGTARIDGNFTIGDASADTLTINAAALSSVSASTWDLVNSSAIALNIESGLMDFDTTNSRIGIGTTAPAGKLSVTDTSNTAAALSLTNNTAATIGAGANTLGVLDLQSTSLTTGNFLNIETNGLTSGKGINLTSTSTGLTTGSMLNVTASGSPGATWTGNLGLFEYITSTDADIDGSALKVGFTGAGAGDGTALNVTTAQTGTNALALRVNDDGTYTDSTPLVVDLNGNLGVGRTSPGMKLDVAGDIRAASGSDFYLGTIGFNDNASTSSGASLIGLFDNTYSNIAANTTVQGAIGELDSAIGNRAYTEDNYVVDSQSLTASVNALDMMLQNVASGSTGIWLDAAGYIYANNATSVVVTDTGRLGVGTTAPATALEVVGEARATRYAFQDDSDTYVDTLGSNEILFVSNGANQALINANGNLGIGTTAPTYKLDVNGDIRTVSGSDFYVGSIGLNDNGSLSSGASLIGLFDNTYSNIAANTTVQGAIGDIDSAIGTRSYTEDNYVVDSQSLTASVNALDMMLQNVASGSTGIWLDAAGYIYANNATSVVVTDTGRLGVGTTAPATALEVVGEARATRYAFQDDSDTYVDTLGSNEILFVSNGANQALINANGNLGIGTTAPTYKLDVNGDIRTVSGSDFYVGSIGLNDNGSLSSGASLIGLFDNTYSNIAANTTVQGAIGELTLLLVIEHTQKITMWLIASP